MLALHLALPRDGHLKAALNSFSYLWGKHKSRLSLDWTYPEIYHVIFKKHKWVDLYGNIKEEIPKNMPDPRVKDVYLRMYVDIYHDVDNSTRRSSTGLFIYINMALIHCLSNKQPIIKTSVFGVEFVVMKHGTETLQGFR